MIHTDIREVALYRGGAYITRTASVDLHQGKQTITIEGLTPTLDPSTISVSVSERVKGSNVQTRRLSGDEQEELRKELRRSLEQIENRIAIRNSQIEIYNRNTDFTQKENISLSDMGDYIAALPEKIEKIQEEIQELEEEKKKLRKKLDDKNRELQAYRVDVDLECEEDGSYPVSLRYFDPNATGSPPSEIHTREDDSLTIRLKARIAQHTIEDWNQVALRLFSGNPSISADLPELAPQHIDFYRPRPAYKNSAPRMMMAMTDMAAGSARAMDEDVEMCEEEATTEIRFDAAETVENDTMMEYSLKGLYDVSHLNEISVDLTSSDVACRYHVIAVPKADSYGYLAAEVKTADIEEIMNTNAIVYHKGTYLGNISLSPDPSKDSYDISLGRDEGVRLKREQKKKFRSNVLLKGQTKIEYVYELEVSNARLQSSEITLIDQIPISDDKSIVIERNEISKAEYNEENGELKWDFTLEPSASRTFTIAYSISWPKDKTLNI